jgi:hypothetical protein
LQRSPVASGTPLQRVENIIINLSNVYGFHTGIKMILKLGVKAAN